MRNILLIIGMALLASCGSGGTAPDANQVAAKKPKEKARYCFFKDDGTKAWKASRDPSGNIVVSGKAYREDGRYKAMLIEPKVTGDRAEVWAGVGANDTGHSTADGWWEVTATIPGSANAGTVAVRCGKRALAELSVPRKG